MSDDWEIPILYQDEWYVACNKPVDLLVHRSGMAPRHQKTLLPILRDQLGQRVYPVHRLDRGTSGVLMFALSSEAAGKLSRLFEARMVEKVYLAVVRGWMRPVDGVIDRPLSPLPGEEPQEACTRYRTLSTIELPIAVGPHPTSRYSLLEVKPETGRRRQIRRHFSGVSHPVIGDGSHGDSRHNRVFRERFHSTRLLLMARRLRFFHPFLARNLVVSCPPDEPTGRLLNELFPDAPEMMSDSETSLLAY